MLTKKLVKIKYPYSNDTARTTTSPPRHLATHLNTKEPPDGGFFCLYNENNVYICTRSELDARMLKRYDSHIQHFARVKTLRAAMSRS